MYHIMLGFQQKLSIVCIPVKFLRQVFESEFFVKVANSLVGRETVSGIFRRHSQRGRH